MSVIFYVKKRFEIKYCDVSRHILEAPYELSYGHNTQMIEKSGKMSICITACIIQSLVPRFEIKDSDVSRHSLP